MAEGMGVLSSDAAHRRAPHMRQNGVGIGPGGNATEIRVIDGRSGLSLDLRPAVPLSRQTPPVKMARAAAILVALSDQRILGMD